MPIAEAKSGQQPQQQTAMDREEIGILLTTTPPPAPPMTNPDTTTQQPATTCSQWSSIEPSTSRDDGRVLSTDDKKETDDILKFILDLMVYISVVLTILVFIFFYINFFLFLKDLV